MRMKDVKHAHDARGALRYLRGSSRCTNIVTYVMFFMSMIIEYLSEIGFDQKLSIENGMV